MLEKPSFDDDGGVDSPVTQQLTVPTNQRLLCMNYRFRFSSPFLGLAPNPHFPPSWERWRGSVGNRRAEHERGAWSHSALETESLPYNFHLRCRIISSLTFGLKVFYLLAS